MALVDRRAELGRHVKRIDDVLDADRHAVQRAAIWRAIERARLRKRQFRIEVHPRFDDAIALSDPCATQSRVTASHVTSPCAIFCTISAAPSWLSEPETLASIVSSCRAAGRGAGDLAEYRAVDQAGAARIVEVEQATDQSPAGIEAADRLIVGVVASSLSVLMRSPPKVKVTPQVTA